MTTTPELRVLTSETEFLEAERALAVERAKLQPPEEINDRINELYRAINESPAIGLLACSVKLRLLIDPDLGIHYSAIAEADYISLRQVAAFLEEQRFQEREREKIAPAFAEKDALDNAWHELESALTEITGLAEVIRNIDGGTDLDEVFPYLGGQLVAHRDKADAAFARLFGLGEHSRLRGGPGPLVVPSAIAEKGGAA